ncbi:MAG: hypothetical protein WBB76_11010 [Gaiellaceae bacterium]
MHFLRVRLHAPAQSLLALAEFYEDRLGLPRRDGALTVGETQLEFVAGKGEPFYHFALLAAGDRFDELLAWAAERVDLLPDPDTGEVVFDFDFWEAKAFYFHDPAGNIVELVSHRGIAEQGDGLIGVSELGLVGDKPAMAAALRDDLGLELWDGTLGAERLAFVGERARTLILAPSGRGWFPTGRPAEPHRVEAVLSGPPAGETELEAGLYRISRR